jgi:ABC-2 type transport system permease protein
VSPIAYIMAVAFLFIAGYFFTMHLVNSRRADLAGFLHNMGVILLFMIPGLTMRLLAEERRQKTMELLMTSPVTPTQIVLGKYLACMILMVVMIALTALYPWIIFHYGGKPDMGPIYTGYLGLVLLMSALVSVGVFTSSFTDNQLVAAVVAFSLLLMFWVVSWLTVYLEPGVLSTTAEALSIFLPYGDFVKGVIETRYYVYYLSFAFVFLFASVRMLEASRWR